MTDGEGESLPPDAPLSKAELRARTMIRRQKRNLRKASAEGFLAGVAAMLRPGDLVMDCGANVGVITAILAETGADVLAFEPDPFAFGELSARFKDHPHATLINAAVGASAGTVRLMRASNFADNPAGASVKSTILPGGRAIDASAGFDVALISFPDLLREQIAAGREVAFVKMDIEVPSWRFLKRSTRKDCWPRSAASWSKPTSASSRTCARVTRRCASG
ncbi:MAG: FkbM family methyltransferase [Pseudorhodobacter sp.]|nr:FkbM family methyltransferase [Pseudorhodobacter sp.]